MRNFKALLKAQFLSFFSGLGGSKKAKRPTSASKISKLILPVFFCALIFGISYLYTFIFYDIMLITSKTQELIPTMLSLSVIVSLIFSFYSSVKVLFGFNDYDMLFSMPIKTHEVVVSKLAFSYVIDFIFTILILAPSIVFSKKFGLDLEFTTVINLVILSLGAPFFSMTISTLLGIIVAFISSRAKRKALIETIFFLAVLIGVFAFSILTSIGEEQTEEIAMLSAVKKIYFIYPLVLKSIDNIGFSLLVFIVQTVAFIIPLAFVCVFYKKIHTFFVSKKTSRKYIHKTQKAKTATRALYKKEIKRIFSSSIYVMNSLLGAFFALVGIVVLSVLCISNGLNKVGGLGDIIVIYIPTVLCFTLFMAPPTNCSISLEGKSFWILRTSPVPFSMVLNTKLLATLTFYLPIGIVSAVLIPIALGLDLITGVEFSLISILLSVLPANAGLLINLLFPMLNWDNENKPIKQGASVLVTMLFGFILAGLFGVGAYFIKVSTKILLLIILLISLLLTILTYLLIIKKGDKILGRKA